MTNTRNILTGLLVLSVLALCFIWPIPNDQLPFHRNGLIYPNIVVALGLFFSSSVARKALDLNKIKFVLIVLWALTFFILINGFFDLGWTVVTSGIAFLCGPGVITGDSGALPLFIGSPVLYSRRPFFLGRRLYPPP